QLSGVVGVPPSGGFLRLKAELQPRRATATDPEKGIDKSEEGQKLGEPLAFVVHFVGADQPAVVVSMLPGVSARSSRNQTPPARQGDEANKPDATEAEQDGR